MRNIVAIWKSGCDKNILFSILRQPGRRCFTIRRTRVNAGKTHATWPGSGTDRSRPSAARILWSMVRGDESTIVDWQLGEREWEVTHLIWLNLNLVRLQWSDLIYLDSKLGACLLFERTATDIECPSPNMPRYPLNAILSRFRYVVLIW